jgi:hypothetical protein
MRVFAPLLLTVVAYAQPRFPFTTSQTAEVVANIELSSPGADWAKQGREAAVATIGLDGKSHQHVMLFAGAKRYSYRVSLGRLSPGKHEVTVERNAKFSASGAALEAHNVKIEEIARSHPDYDVYAYAPALFARLNTVGKFSDIPLLLYCERLRVNDEDTLQYTVIFSNEDGGTSTRTLMSRWGRTTDIEYVYRRSLKSGKAIVQGPNHIDVEYKGGHDGDHPLLMPVTDNNMIAEAKDSPLQFRLAPIAVDLSRASREEIMDRHPIAYEVMVKELEREDKLRPSGVTAGEKISDPRNYLFVDYAAVLKDAAITVLARLKDGLVYSSDLGRADIAISRDGYVRTTIELPPGTTAASVKELLFECRVVPPRKGDPSAHSGTCAVQTVVKVFQLQPDYTPGKSFWSTSKPVDLRTGRGVSFIP